MRERFEIVLLRGRHGTALMGERCPTRIREPVEVSGVPRDEVALRRDMPAHQLRDTWRQPQLDQTIGPNLFVAQDPNCSHPWRIRSGTTVTYVVQESRENSLIIRASLASQVRCLERVYELRYTLTQVVRIARALEEREDPVHAGVRPRIFRARLTR